MSPITPTEIDHVIVQGKFFRVRWVDSSNVRWVAWPETGEPLMLVKYNSEAIYGYIGVSRQRTVAAAHAPSTGAYINKNIKPLYEVAKFA